MSEDTRFLFTYGTLMQGFENPFARRLHDLSTFEGSGTFPGTLYKISWYPGAVYDEYSDNQVHGEIYKLAEQEILLKELDVYEDVFEDEAESLYTRKIIPVRMLDGSELHCWVYLYNRETGSFPVIGSGSFRDAIPDH